MKKIIIGVFLFIGIAALSIQCAPGFFAGLEENTFDVEVTVLFGNNETADASLTDQVYGTSVSIDLTSFPEEFVYFVANGEVIDDDMHTFRVTSDLSIIAVLKDSNEYVGLFIDSNGAFIDANYVSLNGTPTAPDVSGYSKIGYQVDAVNTWEPSVGALTDDQVYTLQYTLDSADIFSITTTNATSSNDTPSYNEVVTVTGSGSQGYWVEDDVIVAYGLTYQFTALSNRDLTFIESTDTPEPIVTYLDISGYREGYQTLLGQVDLPSGYELVEYGFLFSSEEIALTIEQADYVMPSSSIASTNEFVRSLPSDAFTSSRAYAVVDDGVTLDVIYSEMNGFSTASGASDLFISEVLDWDGGTNKAVEIFNGTGEAVNLSSYSLKMNSNANITWGSAIELPDVTLAHGETFVVYNATVQDIIDAGNFSGNVTPNGDDAIGLFKDDVLIDIFGVFGEDPGSSWSIEGGNTADVSVIRNADATVPYIDNSGTYPSWNASDWTATTNTTANLGNHVIEGSSVETQVKPMSLILDDVIADLDAPASVELDADYELPDTTLYGASITWSSSDETVITNTGVVTRSDYGEGDAIATLTYTITVGNDVYVDSIAVTVLEKPSTNIETLLYSTGFESSEEYSSSTTYNNAEMEYFGPDDYQWGILSGTVSTTSPINGNQSAQTRDYTSQDIVPEIVSQFAIPNVTYMTFYAENTNDVKVKVSYSLNGSTWLNEQTFELTSSATQYTYEFDGGNAVSGPVYIRFVADNNGTGNNKERMYIDDVEVYGYPE